MTLFYAAICVEKREMKGDKSNLGKLVDRVLLDSLETSVRSIKNPTVLNQVSDLTRR